MLDFVYSKWLRCSQEKLSNLYPDTERILLKPGQDQEYTDDHPSRSYLAPFKNSGMQ